MIKSKKYPGVYIYQGASRPGDECYYIRFRDKHGKSINEKVGWRMEGYNQDKAAALRGERIQAARHGEDMPSKTNGNSTTFDEAFQSWLQFKKNEGVKTIEEITSRYTNHLKAEIGHMKVDRISPVDINNLTGKLKMSDGSIYHIHHIIRATYKHIITNGLYRGSSPMDQVRTPRMKKIRERILTKEEVTELLRRSKEENEDLYLFILTGLLTGMRLNEILGIHGRDIDMETGTIRVVGKGRDSGKVRYCEVPPELMEIIKKRSPGYNEPLIKGVREYTFKKFVDRLGFNKDVTSGDRTWSVSAHTLRHTYGSWLAAKGTPITVIKELLGHNDISTTMRYIKHAPRAGATYAARLTEGVQL